MKKSGIFIKVFSYTTIFLIVILCVTVGLFSQQFLSFYNTTQTQQLYNSYETLFGQISGKSDDEMLKAAEDFYNANQSFSFYIKDSEDTIIFATPGMNTSDNTNDSDHKILLSIGSNYTLFAISTAVVKTNYSDLIQRLLFALGCMLAIGILGAFIFARQMTKPIKRLVNDTKKMSNLEDVLPAPERQDEIGVLARDVHSMYDKLKDTISKLENEILREREMEEAQRYFFSVASHEMKTPIAATKALVEGMIAGVGDYKDHAKYLREVLKMLSAQNKIISEILELVNLSEDKIIPAMESICLSELIKSITQEYYPIAESREQILKIDVSADIHCKADRNMLERSISNVIMNALQNAPDGAVISVWCETNSKSVRLFVLNTESYIDEAVLPKLFDPFYRVDKARNRSANRSGLGLALVKRMLETMNVPFTLKNTNDGVLFCMNLTINKF